MKQWDAPTLNEAISSSGIKLPVCSGSRRGFAVPVTFKEKYPERYTKLVDGIKRTLANKGVQKFLKKNDIGYTWSGPEQSNKLIQESFEIFKTITSLAAAMNIKVVAEGVEYLEQLEMFNHNKNIVVQGYYYSKPLALENYLEYIQNQQK